MESQAPDGLEPRRDGGVTPVYALSSFSPNTSASNT